LIQGVDSSTPDRGRGGNDGAAVLVERVDFVAIPVRDKDRAAQFYGETLGFERDPKSNARYAPYHDGTNP
jgi:hypothetical protein